MLKRGNKSLQICPECQTEYWAKEPTVCKDCKKKRRRPNPKKVRKIATVNRKGKGEAKRLKYMPYRKYLKTEHWRLKRQEAIEASGNQCQRCVKSSDQLHVHHKCYDMKGNEPLSHLEVLCRGCHIKRHKKSLKGKVKPNPQVAKAKRELSILNREFENIIG